MVGDQLHGSAGGGTRTHTKAGLSRSPLPIGLRLHGASGGSRTHNLVVLNHAPLPIGLRKPAMS